MNDTQKLAEWHLLSQCRQIGPVRFRKIFDHLGANLASVFEMSERELQGIPGMTSAAACQIQSLKSGMGSALDFAEGQLERIAKYRGGFLTLDHPLYPVLLRQSPVCHPIFYYRGEIRRLDPSCPAIAIVGSRNAQPASLDLARATARELAAGSWTIVSGLALGTDAAAHWGALDAGGMTVAVLGCGPDVPYAARSREIYEEIVEKGVVVSEFPFGTKPEPWRLIRRNKTIIGLSQAAFVVQSATKGGAMNAVRACKEQGKAIFTFAPDEVLGDFSGNKAILEEFSGKCVSRSNAAAEINECDGGKMMTGKPLKAGDSCPICGTEMVAITRETYSQMVETLRPVIHSIPRQALKGTAPLLPICPQCDAYALGVEMVEGFPFLDKNGKVGRIDLL